MAREMVDHGRRRYRDPCAEREQRRRGVGDIAFQRRHRRHRIVVEVELMLLDQPRQRLDRQAELGDRLQEFGGDRIALDAAMAGAFSMSVHHCSRISPGNGWLTWSRTREISTLKA